MRESDVDYERLDREMMERNAAALASDVLMSAVEVRPVVARRLLHAYDTRAVSLESAIDTGVESFVQQQFREDADINTIVRRFGLTQALPADVGAGVYGDFTGISDYESAVEMVAQAREAFMRLPAELRDRFGNDVGRLVAYADGIADGGVLQDDFFPPAEPVVEPVPAPAAPPAPSPAPPAPV